MVPVMQSTPTQSSSLYLFSMLAARSHLQLCYYSVPNSASEIRFVLQVDRSAGVVHCYQFLFPYVASKLCRNTCMYLQVSPGPFVRKAGSSNRLQRVGSHSNLKGEKCIKCKNNNVPKTSGISLSVKVLIRQT